METATGRICTQRAGTELASLSEASCGRFIGICSEACVLSPLGVAVPERGRPMAGFGSGRRFVEDECAGWTRPRVVGSCYAENALLNGGSILPACAEARNLERSARSAGGRTLKPGFGTKVHEEFRVFIRVICQL